MRLILDTTRLDHYAAFLKIKRLPQYQFRGCVAHVPQEYAESIGIAVSAGGNDEPIDLHPKLFDYQAAIAAMAIRKRRFSVFADCGLGKTLIIAEFVRNADRVLADHRCALIVSPLMVVPQTIAEFSRWYPRLKCEHVHAAELSDWLLGRKPGRIGITNYEAINSDTPRGRLGCLVLDESSMLKSHYGKWGTSLIRMGRGVPYKLACTGTPAPNDRIEYANHAVFMDAFPNVNSFLAKFFVNRGQTGERWELKPHALRPFYRALSHWCIFLTRPSVYGWHDNADPLPPIHVHIHDVPLTPEQQILKQQSTGHLIVHRTGGIVSRSRLATIAKGFNGDEPIPTHKPDFIARLVRSWPNESTIVWCKYNAEQSSIEAVLPEAGSIRGETPIEERMRIIDAFKSGAVRVLITKPKILGFGLNLQIATRHVFSGLEDSYETYYQAVKRSNRYGATRPLNVHIPITEIERPMIETVLSKAHRVERDTIEQEELFKHAI